MKISKEEAEDLRFTSDLEQEWAEALESFAAADLDFMSSLIDQLDPSLGMRTLPESRKPLVAALARLAIAQLAENMMAGAKLELDGMEGQE